MNTKNTTKEAGYTLRYWYILMFYESCGEEGKEMAEELVAGTIEYEV